MSITLRQKLDQAWELRIQRRIEETLALSADLRQQISSEASVDPTIGAEVQLLIASLARWQGDLSRAKNLVKKSQEVLIHANAQARYRLLFERGHLSFAFGDFSPALDDFLSASAISTQERKLYALANALLCMENLGLPCGRTLEEIRTLDAKLAGATATTNFKNQIEAYELRCDFREGRFATIFEGRPPELVDQSGYYRVWLAMLPYHRYSAGASDQQIEALLGADRLYNRSFRLRTLQGLIHPDDRYVGKPSEWVDRLYLWVWRWLMFPNQFPLSRVMGAIADFSPTEARDRLTQDDFFALRNAVLWLAIFDPRSLEKVEAIVRGLLPPSPGGSPPIFELEYLLLQYLRALQTDNLIQARDFRRCMSAHPLSQERSLHFGAIFRIMSGESSGSSAVDPKLLDFAKRLARAVSAPAEEKPTKRDKFEFRVDCASGEIRGVDRKHKLNLTSKPIAGALRLLHTGEAVTEQAFAAECFGLRRYDPLVHQGKIFNLLARMRGAFAGSVRIGVKDGFVVCDAKWADFQFINTDNEERLGSLPEWRAFVSGPGRSGARPSSSVERPSLSERAVLRVAERRIAPIGQDGMISRRELESILGRSRATVNRLLSRWVEQGLLKPEGASRSIRYRISKELEARLSSEKNA